MSAQHNHNETGENPENKLYLDGHDYDGIEELDNRLPPWLWALMYISFLFSVLYIFWYHVFDGPTQLDEYNEELAKAAIVYNMNQEPVSMESLEIPSDLESIGLGKELYTKNCIACHGALGEGNAVGPNLTDTHWNNGGSQKDIYASISEGIASTAMLPWKNQLSEKQLKNVTAFVISIQGSNPPNAKDPEGELYEPENKTMDSDSANVTESMISE